MIIVRMHSSLNGLATEERKGWLKIFLSFYSGCGSGQDLVVSERPSIAVQCCLLQANEMISSHVRLRNEASLILRLCKIKLG